MASVIVSHTRSQPPGRGAQQREDQKDGQDDGSRDGHDDRSALQASRMALTVLLGVLGGNTLVTVLNVLDQGPSPAQLAVLTVGLVTVLALQFAHSTMRPRTWPVRVRVLTLSAQALVVYVPLAWLGLPWGAMAGLLAGSVLLAVPGRLRWPLYVLATVGVVPVVVAIAGPGLAAYGFGATLLSSLIIFGVSLLPGLVDDINDTRRALAGMAVVQERLRVAGDLHDLLGYSMSAIMLKSELAHRLLPAAPEGARSEIAEILDISQEALSDMQLVATGYRTMSLATECESALSVLSAGQIDTEVTLACGPLPPEVDTVLAIVLRETVTNTLRHSNARRCSIKATLEGGSVLLRVSNDGADGGCPPSGPDGGSGLGSLTMRLRAVGGGLTCGPTSDGRFEVVAHAPATAATGEEQQVTSQPEGSVQAARHWAPRVARAMLIAVLAGYGLVILINAAAQARSAAAMLGFLACFAVVVVVQAMVSLRHPQTWSRRSRVLALGIQAAATYAPLLWLGGPWGSMAGFLAGSLLITVTGKRRWLLYAASAAVLVPQVVAAGTPLADIVYLVDSSLVAGLVVQGFTALYRLVIELHEARGALAQLAVARERLIVERDLHQVLGSSLSTVTMKCALVHRLLPCSPDTARSELSAVLDISRQALADVRRVARGYRGQLGVPPPGQRQQAKAFEWSLADSPPFTSRENTAI